MSKEQEFSVGHVPEKPEENKPPTNVMCLITPTNAKDGKGNFYVKPNRDIYVYFTVEDYNAADDSLMYPNIDAPLAKYIIERFGMFHVRSSAAKNCLSFNCKMNKGCL